MSSTFIEHMREIANDKTLAQKIIDNEIKEKENRLKEQQQKVRHQLFLKLSAKIPLYAIPFPKNFLEDEPICQLEIKSTSRFF